MQNGPDRGCTPWRRARPALRRLALAFLACAAASSMALAQTRPMRFWNLTRHTISELQVAPAGTTEWGMNQCRNDKDGTVDTDERLRITGVQPGLYDVRLKDVSGRICVVRNIKLEQGEVFSIEEKELTACTR
jgi:hypothetical protein